jgi:hypothetical protein
MDLLSEPASKKLNSSPALGAPLAYHWTKAIERSPQYFLYSESDMPMQNGGMLTPTYPENATTAELEALRNHIEGELACRELAERQPVPGSQRS